MEFAVTYRDDHVHVELSDQPTIDPEAPKDYWEILRKVCAEYDCKRILVEGVAPRVELGPAQVAAAGARAATVPNLWLAFNLKNHTPNEQSELYEAVAASKGVRVKFFDNSDDALKWLRSNAPK